MSVAGLVLAAGAGRRMGGPKALISLGGELLVERAIRTLADGGCDPVLVVVGAAADEVRRRAELGGAMVVVHAGWDEGLGSSLTAGLAALAPLDEVTAAVVALADQPWIRAGAVVRLLAAHAGGAGVAVATYDGRRRNPVLLARPTWSDVPPTGDVGARDLARGDAAVAVACTGDPLDLDTPDDLSRARAREAAERSTASL